MSKHKIWLREFWIEIIAAALAVLYIWAYSSIPLIHEQQIDTRLAASSLLLDTIALSVTAVSVLLPATIGIYFYLAHDKSYPNDVVKRFFRAAVSFLLSLAFGLYAGVDVHLATHRQGEQVLLSTRPLFAGSTFFQFYLCFVGVVQMFAGAAAYRRHKKKESAP